MSKTPPTWYVLQLGKSPRLLAGPFFSVGHAEREHIALSRRGYGSYWELLVIPSSRAVRYPWLMSRMSSHWQDTWTASPIRKRRMIARELALGDA